MRPVSLPRSIAQTHDWRVEPVSEDNTVHSPFMQKLFRRNCPPFHPQRLDQVKQSGGVGPRLRTLQLHMT